MAHFEDDGHQRISGQTLPISAGHTRTIYVWGGDFNGNPLVVTSSDPGVLEIQESTQSAGSNYRRFTLRARRDAESVTVIVRPNADGSAAWDTVTFLIHTAAESAEYYRNRVISIARQHLGAHYLWGAAGASPDQLNGMPGRPGSVSILTLASPDSRDVQHSVAVCRVSGFCTCAGKPWQYGQPNSPAFAADATHLDMTAESETRSYRTVYKSYTNSPPRKGIILGEKCQEKRHFDCVGFINYCLSAALGTSVQMDICGNGKSHYRGFANNLSQIAPTAPHQAGDILIFGGSEIESEGRNVVSGAHHIGFSLGDGTHMIHAAETEYGVVTSGIGRDLTRRVRHPRLG